MKEMLNTPIKAFNPAQSSLTSANPAYRPVNSTPTVQTTPQSPSADEVLEGDLPAQFCRLMGKGEKQGLVGLNQADLNEPIFKFKTNDFFQKIINLSDFFY